MQNKHNFFFFLFGNPNFQGGGGGSSRLGQNPNFYRKFVLEASLICYREIVTGHLQKSHWRRSTWERRIWSETMDIYQRWFSIIIQSRSCVSWRDSSGFVWINLIDLISARRSPWGWGRVADEVWTFSPPSPWKTCWGNRSVCLRKG